MRAPAVSTMSVPAGLMVRAALLGALLLGAAGCAGYLPGSRQQAVRERENTLLLREDIRRLNGTVEGLEFTVAKLERDLYGLRSGLSGDTESRLSALEQRLGALETGLAELDKARERDRQELLERLSQTITQAVRQTASSGGPARGTRARSGYGYEHEVQPGQTLSEIAAVYGITVKAITEANDIKDPHLVRVGQKLFIPE